MTDGETSCFGGKDADVASVAAVLEQVATRHLPSQGRRPCVEHAHDVLEVTEDERPRLFERLGHSADGRSRAQPGPDPRSTCLCDAEQPHEGARAEHENGDDA